MKVVTAAIRIAWTAQRVALAIKSFFAGRGLMLDVVNPFCACCSHVDC